MKQYLSDTGAKDTRLTTLNQSFPGHYLVIPACFLVLFSRCGLDIALSHPQNLRALQI
jgi:hypothetical protein